MLATTRVRLGHVCEWGVAAAFLAATFAVALLIVGELSDLRAPGPAGSGSAPAPSSLPEAIPGPAVAVPALQLSETIHITVGDTLDHVSSLIGPGEETGLPAGAGRLGPRSTRSYRYGNARFLLVFEPFERGGTLRVSGIYIQ